MKTAADPFRRLIGSGWKPDDRMVNPDNYPVRIEVPAGPITIEGTRRNARMVVEYVEGWLTGRGAKGIDSLAGKPGVHPALMEDLATGRMSVAQLAQRIRHGVHGLDVVKRLLEEERDDILSQMQTRGASTPESDERYAKATRIAL